MGIQIKMLVNMKYSMNGDNAGTLLDINAYLIDSSTD